MCVFVCTIVGFEWLRHACSDLFTQNLGDYTVSRGDLGCEMSGSGLGVDLGITGVPFDICTNVPTWPSPYFISRTRLSIIRQLQTRNVRIVLFVLPMNVRILKLLGLRYSSSTHVSLCGIIEPSV